ncbi:hypothetical protein Taro_016453, partial [Colocasia esculenta]|nr:hypothetical protein [Colocasia esculenta]
ETRRSLRAVQSPLTKGYVALQETPLRTQKSPPAPLLLSRTPPSPDHPPPGRTSRRRGSSRRTSSSSLQGIPSSPMASPELEEQQEKLRRAVDGWRCRSLELLKDLRGDAYASCSPSAGAGAGNCCGAGFRPIGVRVEPLEHSDLPSLVDSDNVDVAKFVMVLSYDCVEIARLRRHAARHLYRQLLLFGHRASPQEVLLEGEPQKAFGQSLSLFMELYETVSRMAAVLGNLLQQLDYVYSRQDKNGPPYRSFKNVSLRSVLESFGEGLAVLLVLDEILRRNTHIKSYLSLFRRMLSKVKLELDTFDISVKDLDSLDQVVGRLEKLLDGNLYHCMLHEGPYLNDMFQKLKCNKRVIDAFSLCVYDGLMEILPRLDTWKEFPLHRMKILQHVAVFLFIILACAETPEKKLRKVIIDMLQVVPVIYVDCGIRFTVLDLIKNQCPQLVSSWPTLREAVKDYNVLMKNYLTQLSETHSRYGITYFCACIYVLTVYPCK